MDDFSKFQGKKKQLSIWHDGLINYLRFYWNWIKACWGFHSASAMPIPIDSPRLLSHISHDSYLWYCGFSVVGSSSSMTWEIKTLLIPDEIIKNLQLNRNRFVLIRFQPPSKKKKRKLETRCPRMTWISPSSSLAHQLPKNLKENAIKISSTFPQSVGWLVWSFTAVQVTSQTPQKKEKKKTMFESHQIEEKKVGPVSAAPANVCRVGGRGLMLLTAKLTMGRAGARTFESLNVTCHLASFKSGRSFSSHARSLSFSYFRYPRQVPLTRWCSCALTDDGTVTCYIKWGERRLYLELPRYFFFISPVFFTRPACAVCVCRFKFIYPQDSINSISSSNFGFWLRIYGRNESSTGFFQTQKKRRRRKRL